MAATFNVFFKISGVLNGTRSTAGELHNPSALTTSSDVIADKTITVASATTATLLTIGTGEDITSAVGFVVIPSVAGHLCWSSATAANNSAIVCVADVPVILPSGNTLPYQTTVSNRIDETAEAITTISFRNTGLASGKVRIFAIG